MSYVKRLEMNYLNYIIQIEFFLMMRTIINFFYSNIHFFFNNFYLFHLIKNLINKNNLIEKLNIFSLLLIINKNIIIYILCSNLLFLIHILYKLHINFLILFLLEDLKYKRNRIWFKKNVDEKFFFINLDIYYISLIG